MSEILQQIAFREPRVAAKAEAAAEDTFAALVTRHSRFVFRVAYSVLRNAHDAEDVAQETFLKIYRLRGWEHIHNERAFLARTAWRLAVERAPRAQADADGLDIPSSRENPEQAVIAADWNAAVHRLIEALPEELRLPLTLSTVEEMKSHEIAAVMGIPEGTVRGRLMRARQTLKQKLLALMEGPRAK
jgi:RNA polymerase sigma-70 factor (ECF subfamily)